MAGGSIWGTGGGDGWGERAGLLIVSAAAASGSEEKDEKWLSLENIAS
jgi:hypothetical protein